MSYALKTITEKLSPIQNLGIHLDAVLINPRLFVDEVRESCKLNGDGKWMLEGIQIIPIFGLELLDIYPIYFLNFEEYSINASLEAIDRKINKAISKYEIPDCILVNGEDFTEHAKNPDFNEWMSPHGDFARYKGFRVYPTREIPVGTFKFAQFIQP